MVEKVLLVDEKDNFIKEEEKLKAHQKGELHRAISVFIFNSNGKLLIQQRADKKYHSAGLWANTCCSHPRINETIQESCLRRLNEEIGVQIEHVQELFTFIYTAKLDHNLIEHELDHVCVGFSDQKPSINPDEVKNYAYETISFLKNDVINNPKKYAEWFKILINKYGDVFTKYSNNI